MSKRSRDILELAKKEYEKSRINELPVELGTPQDLSSFVDEYEDNIIIFDFNELQSNTGDSLVYSQEPSIPDVGNLILLTSVKNDELAKELEPSEHDVIIATQETEIPKAQHQVQEPAQLSQSNKDIPSVIEIIQNENDTNEKNYIISSLGVNSSQCSNDPDFIPTNEKSSYSQSHEDIPIVIQLVETEDDTSEKNYIISSLGVNSSQYSNDPDFIPTNEDTSSDSETKSTSSNENSSNDIETISSAQPTSSLDTTRKSRKRKAQPETWKRNERKLKRMAGKNYESRKGKIIPEKQVRHIDCQKCRFKCSAKISNEHQSVLHQEYWALADSDRQKAYLCSLVSETSVARQRKRDPESTKIKSKSRVYTLFDNHGKTQRVCLKFFCATFSISFQIIDLALKKRGPGGAYIGCDGRKGKTPANITPEVDRNHVKHHIDSFPRMESHYSRRDTKKLYLAPDLNISIMYRLYRDEYCSKEKIKPVSINIYRAIFKGYDPQLSFHIPKKDQCSICNIYYDALDKSLLQDNWKLHKKREEEAMSMKKSDKEKALEVKGVNYRAITFDLEAILIVPFSADSQIYYKRKLSVFNFTIYDSFNQNGHCYLWDETHGSKGASEIGTCLLKYLHSLPETVEHVASFSDTCGGQNRNQFVCAAMLYAVEKIQHLRTIDLKFMESGHSYLEADSIHATIEHARKHKKIFTTEEWAVLISMARQKPHPYGVNTLTYPDFYDLQKLASIIMQNRKTNTLGESIKWLHVKWFRFEKSKPFVIQYKYSLRDQSFLEFNVLQTRRITMSTTWESINLKCKYSKRLPISEQKKKDLLFLVNKEIIPVVYKNYFESLPCSKKSKDLALWCSQEEGEEED